MSKVRAKDTGPELRVRSALHSLGYRFRLHRGDLPGRPDIVLPKHGLCIFVHGCFWHRHIGCKRATVPVNNATLWQNKFARTIERDDEAIRLLRQLQWRVAVVWECETKEAKILDQFIRKHIDA